MSSLQRSRRKEQNKFCLEARGMGLEIEEVVEQWGEMTQIMYVHMNI
jgi:hypothetical protein